MWGPSWGRAHGWNRRAQMQGRFGRQSGWSTIVHAFISSEREVLRAECSPYSLWILSQHLTPCLCSGCHTMCHRWGLKWQKFMFSQFWGLEILVQGCCDVLRPPLSSHYLTVCSHDLIFKCCAEGEEKERGKRETKKANCLVSVLTRPVIPRGGLIFMVSPDPHYLPNASSPHIITVVAKASIY